VANPFFQFKKFIVHQQHTSMKVCTDACLFGAWVSQKQVVQNATKILDIGAGTGLLSLMMGQVTETSKASITAIEIEAHAAAEANSNFELSNWKDRMELLTDSIQNFTKVIRHSNEQVDKTFDLIITNPPFFEGDLKSPDVNKNKAAHSTELPWSVLIENTADLLSPTGSFFVLVPTLRAYTMQKLAEAQQLHLVEEVLVYNDAKHLPFRAILHFKRNKTEILRNKLIIKDVDNKYTPEFTHLLKDYYLHL
jgi:tRNA1Val (adenine37-N6)-methyltransferase